MPIPAGMAPLGAAAEPAGTNGSNEPAAEEDADAEIEAMAAMGFPTGFASTAGEEVVDKRCKVEGINKKEVRKYRQYMNRRGGFNRPLEEGGGPGF